jgi:hypothetical protein
VLKRNTNKRKKEKKMILSVILSGIFLLLALIHFNWVIGGTFGFAASLPTNENGERVLNPKKIDSAIVAIGLTTFAFFYAFKSGILQYNLPEWILKYGGWIIPILFLLRAIGDFKYVGVFKKIRKTTFGKIDTKLFTPLCLTIAVFGLIIQFYY